MKQSNDVINRMNSKYSVMSKGQKLLCAYISDHVDKAAFLTASKLGSKVGVSESTVVRFAISLGYKGYPEFQKSLEQIVRDRLEVSEPKKASYGKKEKGGGVLKSVLAADAQRLKETLAVADEKIFESAVSMVCAAKTVYIIGFRNCSALAQFLGYHLSIMFQDVRVICSGNASEVFEKLVHLTKDDVVIGISFPRYSMLTLKALEYANSINASVMTITDSVHSPVNLYSSCNLLAGSDLSSVVESMAAPMSVANALIIALSVKKKDELFKNADVLEKVFDDFGVEGNDDLEYTDDRVRFRYDGE